MELLNGAMFHDFQVVEKMETPVFVVKELWILQAATSGVSLVDKRKAYGSPRCFCTENSLTHCVVCCHEGR